MPVALASSIEGKLTDDRRKQYDVLGEAYDIKTGELRYIELHTIEQTGKVRRMHYVDNQGSTIGEKIVDYGIDQFAPVYNKIDLRQRSVYRGEYLENGFKLTTFRLDKQEKPIENDSAVLALSDHLVADSGFDNLVRHHWHRLMGGEAIVFEFVVPSRRNTTEMSVRRSRPERCAVKLTSFAIDLNAYNKDLICFEMRAESWLINQLLKPILLSYDIDSQRLTYYSGLSDIRSFNNKSLRVNIYYQYF